MADSEFAVIVYADNVYNGGYIEYSPRKNWRHCMAEITRSHEIMMNLLENCGLTKEMAAVETLMLGPKENILKMADWLEKQNFRATEDEIAKTVSEIRRGII